MASWEDFARQQLGVPVQNIASGLGSLSDDQIALLKQKALHQAALNASGHMSPTMTLPGATPEVGPNSPSMSNGDAQNRMGAMIQAPQTMQQVEAKLRAQADQDALAEAHQNALEDEDMSGFRDVPKPGQQRFQQLKQQVAPKPMPADPRSKTSPTKPLDEDQESQINNQLRPKDDEDED